MAHDELIEHCVFGTYMITFVTFVYLLIGGGITGLALLSISPPYRAIVSVPVEVVYGALAVMFLVGIVTISNKTLDLIIAILTAIGTLALLVIQIFISPMNTILMIEIGFGALITVASILAIIRARRAD